MYKIKKLIKSKYFSWLLVAIGIVGLSLGLVIYMSQPKPPVLSNNKVKSVDVDPVPSSVKPKASTIASYSVPANNPRYIAIPAIGIANTPVLQLGLLKSGAIATPDNIFEVGWYGGSSLPGQSGAMFIYGHVSSWTANGIFYNLHKLVPGDKVIITTGNNTIYTYQVVESKVYPYTSVPMNSVLSPVSTSTTGLNLMTCTGKVIPGTSEFNERLVVYTKLISS